MESQRVLFLVICVLLTLWGAVLLFAARSVWDVVGKLLGNYAEPSRGLLLFARICGFGLFVAGIGMIMSSMV